MACIPKEKCVYYDKEGKNWVKIYNKLDKLGRTGYVLEIKRNEYFIGGKLEIRRSIFHNELVIPDGKYSYVLKDGIFSDAKKYPELPFNSPCAAKLNETYFVQAGGYDYEVSNRAFIVRFDLSDFTETSKLVTILKLSLRKEL